MNPFLQFYIVGLLAAAALYLYVSYTDTLVNRDHPVARNQPVWLVLSAVAMFAVFSWVAFIPMAYAVLVLRVASKDRP